MNPTDGTGGPAIVARSLGKSFPVARARPGRWGKLRALVNPLWDNRIAVRDVSMVVPRGELVALLGRNGAGKSTTIKMLTGLLAPTSGEVLVDGRVPHRDRRRNARSIGAVFGQRTQLWWDLPARQSFALLADIFDLSRPAYLRRIDEFDALLDLSDFWDTPVRHLSLGQRVRCDLAGALLHDPPIVFLDEPTIGMDVAVKDQVREFLRHQVTERGRTVLLTTHDMTDVARLCERVLLIDDGELIFDGTLTRLRREHGTPPLVHVTFAAPVPVLELNEARVVTHDGTRASLAAHPGGSAQDVVRALIARYPLADLVIEEGNLEDLMRDLYRARQAQAPDRIATR